MREAKQSSLAPTCTLSGFVLYELLTGARPIKGDGASTLIAGHLFRPPQPFSKTDPEGAGAPRCYAVRYNAPLRNDRTIAFGTQRHSLRS